MKKKIFGFNIGITSIGRCVVNFDNEKLVSVNDLETLYTKQGNKDVFKKKP